jgi:DNA-directed RNA polymerase specialized sigma24 family protein
LKRAGGIFIPLEERHAVTKQPGIDLLLIDAALERLGAKDPELVRLIDLRYFGGMTAEEIAQAGGESVNVVRHNLRYAQAWLRKDLSA